MHPTPYPKKIVLHCRKGYQPELDALVEAFIRDGVSMVAVAGVDCGRVEDIIDEIVVGDGSRNYFMLTSSHPGESVAGVMAFARSLTGEYAGEALLVEI